MDPLATGADIVASHHLFSVGAWTLEKSTREQDSLARTITGVEYETLFVVQEGGRTECRTCLRSLRASVVSVSSRDHWRGYSR
jgi:hypothetical protein